MKKIIAGSLAALTAGAALAAAAPASAEGWRHHDHDAGAAIAAGVAGLAIGAALASDHRHAYVRDYDDDYGPYYGPRAYYGPPAYYYGYPERCRTEWRWDPRWGHYDRVRVCY